MSVSNCAMRRPWPAARALCLILTIGLATTTPAVAAGRYASLIVDGNSGRVISEQAADEPRYPASLTKMMTLYVVFDLIEQGKLSYNTRIVFSDQATRVQPTKLGIEAGDGITLMEAVKGLITKSANDASVAIAEHIAGSEPKFAALMTQTARRIGMAGTTFKNAHGLPNPEQVTTARDMVTLGLRLQDDFPKHYPLFSSQAFTFRGESHRNHNTMLLTYEGTDGIKTGFIGSSGFNLVANVRRNGKHVIGVVFGGASAAARNQTMRTLLNVALVKSSPIKTRQPAIIARAKPVPNPAPAPRPIQVATAQPVADVPPTAAIRPALRQSPQPSASPLAALAPSAVPVQETQIQVAAVRPLLVAPRQPKQAPPVAVATLPEPAPVASTPSRVLAPQPTPLTTATLTPAAMAPPAPSRGAAPSTFGQQAQNLARGQDALTPAAPQPGQAAIAPRPQQVAMASASPRSNLAGPPITTMPTMAAGPYQIQVGAYATEAEAQRQIASVRAQTGTILAAHQAVVVSAQNNGRAVFRARLTGFDVTTGGNLCNELRRRQIDCMVAKAE